MQTPCVIKGQERIPSVQLLCIGMAKHLCLFYEIQIFLIAWLDCACCLLHSYNQEPMTFWCSLAYTYVCSLCVSLFACAFTFSSSSVRD